MYKFTGKWTEAEKKAVLREMWKPHFFTKGYNNWIFNKSKYGYHATRIDWERSDIRSDTFDGFIVELKRYYGSD